MTGTPARPVHLTDTVARTLTRAEILKRVDDESKYILGKSRKTAADHARYNELMRIMYEYVPPGKVLEAMKSTTDAITGGTGLPDFWDSRPCDDNPEEQRN